VFDELAIAVKEVAALDPSTMTDGELGEAVVELARLRRVLEAGCARIADGWNTRRVWAADDARSGAVHLAVSTGSPKDECQRLLSLGRAMRQLPLAGEAFAAGEIGGAHLRRLAGMRHRRTLRQLERDEAMLVEHARTLRFDDFSQVVDYWRLRADPDGADETDVERRDRRRVSFDETLGGMWSGSMFLDPVSGAIVDGELRRREQALFEEDWAEAKARLGREPKVGELARTPDQRRADALVAMARRSGTAPADGKAPKPLFTVVLGNEAFSRLSQLANGRVVSPRALEPWLDDAELERILFAQGSSRVIDVSYRRSFTGALRRLIEVRDQRCYHRWCDVPADRCQVDHVVPWGQGGITAQENGRLACGPHNRARNRPPPRE
jgi:hypothetical protein